MTATACTVNRCTTPARLTHNVYGDSSKGRPCPVCNPSPADATERTP